MFYKNYYILLFHWNKYLLILWLFIGLAEGRQTEYRRSTSDVRQAALQRMFPMFRSTSSPGGPGSSPGAAVLPNSAGDFMSRIKCRRNRTVFTDHHLTSLERSFERQKYLTTKEQAILADRLGLTQIQVNTWYQKRRMKWKRRPTGGLTLESGPRAYGGLVNKLWRYVAPFSSDTGTLQTDRQTDRFAISISRVSILTLDNYCHPPRKVILNMSLLSPVKFCTCTLQQRYSINKCKKNCGLYTS